MGRRIRWLGVVMILCFTLVVLQLANIQFRRASALNSDPKNPRNIAVQYDNQRGNILAADGSVLADSKGIKPDPWHYQRIYPSVNNAPASLYSSVVGYDSPYFGTNGVEYQYNSYLVAHSQPAR